MKFKTKDFSDMSQADFETAITSGALQNVRFALDVAWWTPKDSELERAFIQAMSDRLDFIKDELMRGVKVEKQLGSHGEPDIYIYTFTSQELQMMAFAAGNPGIQEEDDTNEVVEE